MWSLPFVESGPISQLTSCPSGTSGPSGTSSPSGTANHPPSLAIALFCMPFIALSRLPCFFNKSSNVLSTLLIELEALNSSAFNLIWSIWINPWSLANCGLSFSAQGNFVLSS